MSSRSRRASAGVTGRGARLDLRPDVVWHLALQVSHLVRQAALTKRARQAFLDGADDPGRPVAGNQQRVGQAAPAHILIELLTAGDVLLVPGARCNSDFVPSARMPQAASTASRGWPRCS